MEPTQAAPQRKAGDTRGRKQSSRSGQPESLRFAVEVTPGEPGLGAHRLPEGVDADAPHGRQIDHQPVVADGVPRDAVPTSTYGNQKFVRMRELHAGNDVAGACSARNQ